MLIHELTTSECVDFLARHHLGRLACAHDNQPYIVPISFTLQTDEQCLYGFATLGQKIEWMRNNPKVCVAVDEIADKSRWTSVVATGRYQEIGTTEKDEGLRQRAQQLFQQRAEWWLPATAVLASGEEHDRPIFYRIRIDVFSGRRAGVAT